MGSIPLSSRMAIGVLLAGLWAGSGLAAPPSEKEMQRPKGQAQAPAEGKMLPPPKSELLPPPKMEDQNGTPTTGATDVLNTPAMPITLPVALRLAQTNNLDIAQAREYVSQAEAGFERAWSQILPTAGLGSTFVDHQGRIQQGVGNILNTHRESLFVGGGPSLSFQFADAIFQPLAARQVLTATQAGVQRVTNDTLLAVTDAYVAVLRARRRLARAEETLDTLTSSRPTDLRGKSKGLLPLVRDYVEVGGKDAFRSDLERVRVEVVRREEEGVVARQDFRLAAAELARLLRLDPGILLVPVEDFRFPLVLPGDEFIQQDLQQLVGFALNNRPELAENQALVRAALERIKDAQYRPFLPVAVLNYSSGGFGGSPNFVTKVPGSGIGVGPALGEAGVIQDFGSRADFDVSLFWRLQNLGFGNQAEIREQRSLHQQAVLRQMQMQDRVVTQVVQSQELVLRSLERLGITRNALFNDQGEPTGPVYRSLGLNFERIRGAEGRPLEVLDSIRGLNDVLDQYINSLSDYDRGRFRLLIALGMPSDAIISFHPPGPAPAVEQVPPPAKDRVPLQPPKP